MKDYSYEILDLLKQYGGDEQAVLEAETRTEILYALSPLRENLLEWVELGADCRVLQIGSDYGSCTGLLAKRAGEVVVIDALDENLEVNRVRHGKAGNVFYVSGEISGIPDEHLDVRAYPPGTGEEESVRARMERPFDAVILLGMPEGLEKEAALSRLLAAAAFVKPGGKLLFAAENNMGVRYLMGAVLSQTGFIWAEFRGLFEELKDRQGGTFSMYYPVPDYRYPVSIYSDGYLPQTGDVTNISARLEQPGFWFGNEEEAMAKACQNGEFPKFANSFLGVWEKGKS